ncbi:MAG TPA: phenylalanine--tRNA ligase subunit beta [Actinomycetota bacterium]
MRIPLDWLREYAPTDMPADDLAELINHRGVKVEGVLRPWSGLDGVVVVRVLEVRDHPNSDKLCVARIQHGSGESELVVGVRNMRPGDLVPWAPPGARVPVLDDPLGTREIRGVVSNGMLCSPRELAISQDHGGILVLDGSWEVGDGLKAGLGLDDAVLDIEVEPNRPDFLSIIGVAREVAAATGVPLQPVDLALEETDDASADVASVRIDDPQGCPRYVARVVRGVSHRPSHLRAQARLTACGMRPIDAVVDATNYAMLELGQPLHGFDIDRITGPGIVVRRARDAERIVTLDDVERHLVPDDLLICDLERPVAIAGIMGGQTSEVSPDTSNVLLEAAYFTRGRVLLSARRLGLHSEASHRFERGTDPEGLEAGAARGAKLIAAWAGGEVLRGIASAGAVPPRRTVAMRPSRASHLLGYPVSATDATAVFDALGMAHEAGDDVIDVEVPGYRTDIDQEVDLIEEVVRIQGYDRVGATLPRAPHAGGVPGSYAFARRAKDALARAGLQEIRPAPFASADDLALFDDVDAVPVANPLRAEEGFLRTRLSPGLLRTAARNQALGVERIALFEVGITFRLGTGDEPFREFRKAGFVLCGPATVGWDGARREVDALDGKGVLERVMDDLGVTGVRLGDVPAGPFHPGRSASVLLEGRSIGVLGEVHPRVAAALDLTGRVVLGIVGLGSLEAASGRPFEFRDVPRFPPVRRDLAFVVADRVPAGAMQAAIEEAAGDLLGVCELFDVFRGGSIPAGRKSLAFAVDLRADDRTLTDEDAQARVDAIVARVASEFGAELRTG